LGEILLRPLPLRNVFEDQHRPGLAAMLLDLRAHELDRETSAIFAIEELLAETGIRRLRVALGPILIEDLLFRLADQLRQGPAGDFGDRRVDKGGLPLRIQATDALTGGIQNEFVAIRSEERRVGKECRS